MSHDTDKNPAAKFQRAAAGFVSMIEITDR
jgi:hypothetical protein